MSVPMSLAYAVNRLQGFSTNYFRLETVNQSKAGPYGTITLNLPTNSIVNLKSLALHTKAKTQDLITFNNSDTPSVSDTLSTQLPRIDQLIARMELYAGGIQCGSSGFQQYNTVSSVMKNTYQKLQRAMSYDRVLMNNEIRVVPEDYYKTSQPYILNNFLGLIGQSSPDYLSTDLIPSMQLRLYLAGPEVLGCIQKSKGPGVAIDANAKTTFQANATFELDDLYFTVETISFADGMLDAAIDRRIMEEGFIEMPFCNYYTFFQNNQEFAGSTRFSLSSQSIDALYAVQRPSAYASTPGLTRIDNNVGTEYQPNYFNFQSGKLASAQFNVNNMFVPNYRSDALDAFNLMTIAKSDNYDSSSGCRASAVENWYNNFWQFVVRLNMPMSGMDSRNISGVDSRGLASQMYFQVTGGSGNDLQNELTDTEVTIIAECTSTLKIGPGRQIQVDI